MNHVSSPCSDAACVLFFTLNLIRSSQGKQPGAVSPPPTADGLTEEEMTIDGQLMLTMHNLRHIECHLTGMSHDMCVT